jgi:hypothetical protein
VLAPSVFGSSGRSTTTRASSPACARPYAAWSPWNTPLVGAQYQADSAAGVKLIQGGQLSSDPTQYTYPLYYVTRQTPRVQVKLDGWYSNVGRRGRSISNREKPTLQLPIPAGAHAAEGSDGQMIVIDRRTGDEWGMWQYDGSSSGGRATNGYHYNIRWSAVPPQRFVSRGAGVPYLTGLVRPCEIRRGRITHALAFAFPTPSREHVYPATKSDGSGRRGVDIPEGARLQLDPSISASQIRGWGCRNACFTIARALQRYGMYLIDNSGRPKIMMEYENTAHWRGKVTAKTPNPIPLDAFKLVQNTDPSVQAHASNGHSGTQVPLRYTVFDRGDATREVVTISRSGGTVARIRRSFHMPVAARPTSVLWKPSRPGTYSFCVQALDPAGHAGGPSCGSVLIR